MKKITALAAALVLCAAHASAYENSYAGYSVKDGQPYYKLEAKKVYAYTNISSKKVYQDEEDLKHTAVNIVNYYTAEDMEQILGEKFSTAYFDAEYEKLALLERSQLNPKTVPAPLLELEKYAEHDSNGNLTIQSKVLKEKLEKLTPLIKTGKIAGKKAITISYLYKQGDVLVKIDTSLVSANDRLYLLSTVNTDQDLYASKKDEKAADADADIDETDTDEENEEAKTEPKNAASIKEEMEKALEVENVFVRDVPAETMQRFDAVHNNLLKGFKAFTPVSTPKTISYTDAAAGKSVQLPDDWFYGQLNLKYKDKGTFYLTLASSMKEMQEVAANTDYDSLYSVLAIPQADPEYQKKVMELYSSGARNVLQHWNHLLITASVDNITDAEIKELLSTPVANRLAVESFISEGLQRMKGFSNDYFALTDYKTNFDFTKEKALIDINADTKLLKDFAYNNKILLSCSQKAATAMLFIKKTDVETEKALEQQLNEWHF
ncbi:hypothetical protein [uncultured Phascolarctobacterium sp.]|uniref:hypothetical protein n=1 Tax=uncultured Phascolarctobacterium sp. TaxID=512296 RepID=UPI0025D10EA8|nr:hypothetical protein [uncultured Phascolarctobacterium sp.]